MTDLSTDLSTIHQTVSDLFPWPKTADDWDAYRLTAEQVNFFHEHGYLAGVPVLNAKQIAALQQELAELVQPKHAGQQWWYEYHSNESSDPNAVLFHALGAWRLRPGLHDLLWNPAIVMAAHQLLGGSVRFWHDQLFCKPARHGGVVAWHQDYSYWTRTQPMAHLTCWMGLDDSTRENGCVMYIPGSHRWELLPITGLAGDMDAIKQVLNAEQWQQFQNPVAAEVPAGHAIFHHPLMVHGSQANQSPRPRRAIVLNFVRDGVCSSSNEPLLAGVPAIAAGEPLAGQFFPLLYDQPSDTP